MSISDVFFVALVIAFLLAVVFVNTQRLPPISPGASPEPAKAPPEPTGLVGLEAYLDQRRIDEEAAKQEHQEHREKLIAVWAQIEPNVMKAIEIVNVKLVPHGELRLVPLSAPEFVGAEDSGYGFTCRVDGIFDSRIPLIVTEDALFVAGFFHWGEGIKIPIERVTIQTTADAIADGVKWAVEG